jgi:hypothetical protein
MREQPQMGPTPARKDLPRAAQLLSALPHAPASAAKPPYAGCVAVTKQEYDSAKKQHMLRTRFTEYVRTGLPGRRQYWYCR